MIPGASTLFRTLLIYSLCIPLALFIGYIVTDPLNASTFIEMGFVAFLLTIPLLLKWHHEILIISWNLGAMFFFLPGRPEAWLAAAWMSFIFASLQYILNPRQKFLSVPSISKPLLFLVAVVVTTAVCRGGFGLAAFGSDTYGGKKYLLMLSAVIGFFALTSRRLPPRRAVLMVVLFLLSSATIILGDLAGFLAPGLYYIYLIFPLGEYGYESVMTDFGAASSPIARMGGVAFSCASVAFALLVLYGVRGLFDARKLLRLGLFLLLLVASLLGGFRLVLIQIALTFTLILWLEGLFRSRLAPVIVIAMTLLAVTVIGFSDKMPLNIQRTLSFLPVKIDPVARASADDSTEWRLKMWRNILPEVPRYLFLGKGFAFSGAELEALTTARAGGRSTISSEGSALAGDYHNGPLSIILPFGIWGAIAFLWFIAASLRVLYQNYKFGHPAFKKVNTFLFAYFLTKTVLFMCVYGSLYSDLSVFIGLIGLGIAVNGGVAKPFLIPRPQLQALRPLRVHPARRPAGAVSHA